MLSSAILKGRVYHRRFQPNQHQFSYPTSQWWLALDELEQVSQSSRWFSLNGFAPLQFRRTDYLGGGAGDLAQVVRDKLSELTGEEVTGRVYFLGNLRTFGLYFSPINCYFVEATPGQYSYMLAEVSNTPWNERHYYALDLAQPLTHPKAFHVSPFNPIEMDYKWRITAPLNEAKHRSSIHLEAHREQREFSATLTLQRQEMNPRSIRHVVFRYPINTATTVLAIYWQALKLWFKKTPIYDHSA